MTYFRESKNKDEIRAIIDESKSIKQMFDQLDGKL